ncbi:MAG: BspA family leucine-rich repeat surface protein [Candidatus Saccharimonadales bacterium]
MNISKKATVNTVQRQVIIVIFALSLLVVAVFMMLSSVAAAYSADAFVMKVDTRKAGANHKQFIVPTIGTGYNYTIDCDNSGPLDPVSGVTGHYTCEYASPGVYTVVITGDFPQIRLGHPGPGIEDSDIQPNAKSLISIEQWGSQQWRSMETAFAGAANINIASDAGVPDLSQVTTMRGMFMNAYAFNSPIDNWDVSNVTDMAMMLFAASSFDKSLASWKLNEAVSTSYLALGSGISTAKYDATLAGWAARSDTQPNVSFDATGLRYCAAAAAHTALAQEHGWVISNDTQDCSPPLDPKITNVSFAQEGSRLMMTVTGSNLLMGIEDINGPSMEESFAMIAIRMGQLVYVNGEKYAWCIPDDASPIQKDNYMSDYSASLTSPCFDHGDPSSPSGETLFTNTQFKIWLPDDFDTNAPGTVRIWKTPEFSFNQSVVPPAAAQPLTSITPGVSVTTPLRTGTLSVDPASTCNTIDTPRTELLSANTVPALSGVTIFGGVGFELVCSTAGGSADVSLSLGEMYADPSVLTAYKYIDDKLVPVDATFINRDGATHLEFRLTDGLTNTATNLIDEDGVADGRIVDPLYIGIATGKLNDTITPGAPNAGFGRIAGLSNAAIAVAVTAALLVATVTAILWQARRARS